MASSSNGYTYIVRAGDTHLYKIGSSQNVKQRLTSLQSGSAQLLEIIATVEGSHIEKVLHTIFAEYRQHGEWFQFDNPMLVLIVKAAAHQQSRFLSSRHHLRVVNG